MKKWNLFKRLSLPNELQKVTDVDFDWVEEQTTLIEKITQFIGLTRYKAGISTFTITPVSGTKRFRNMVKKFGDDNLEISRSVNNIDSVTRRMDIHYRLVLFHEERVYRIEVGVFLVGRFAKSVTSRFDNHLQDICNVQVMSYLKTHYPFLWGIFGKCIELPALKTIECSIKSRLKFYMARDPFCLQGKRLMCNHSKVHYLPNYEKQVIMVGDLLGFPRQEMIGDI